MLEELLIPENVSIALMYLYTAQFTMLGYIGFLMFEPASTVLR